MFQHVVWLCDIRWHKIFPIKFYRSYPIPFRQTLNTTISCYVLITYFKRQCQRRLSCTERSGYLDVCLPSFNVANKRQVTTRTRRWEKTGVVSWWGLGFWVQGMVAGLSKHYFQYPMNTSCRHEYECFSVMVLFVVSVAYIRCAPCSM